MISNEIVFYKKLYHPPLWYLVTGTRVIQLKTKKKSISRVRMRFHGTPWPLSTNIQLGWMDGYVVWSMDGYVKFPISIKYTFCLKSIRPILK